MDEFQCNYFLVTSKVLALFLIVALLSAVVADEDRMAGQYPDFSGVWGTMRVINPKTGGSGMADPPLSEAGQAIVDEFRGQYNLEGHEPNAHCVEPGMPTMFFGYGSAPLEVIQQDNRITLLTELGMQVRRIYIDLQEMPEFFPNTRVGFSTAAWQDDVLEIETTRLTEWYLRRWPHSDQSKIMERWYLKRAGEVKMPSAPRFRDPSETDPDTWLLVNELTLIDPALYDEPQSMKIYLRPLGDHDILEDNCIEGLWWLEMEKIRRSPG